MMSLSTIGGTLSTASGTLSTAFGTLSMVLLVLCLKEQTGLGTLSHNKTNQAILYKYPEFRT